VDGEVRLSDLSAALVREVERLEPFGQQNPRPVFAAAGLRHVGNPRIVGARKNHLSFMVRQERTTLRVIAMNKADWIEGLRARKGETFSLAFQPMIDTYRGGMGVELGAEDIQWTADQEG
jgi:single-stranded-DNA-specific exonuclease